MRALGLGLPVGALDKNPEASLFFASSKEGLLCRSAAEFEEEFGDRSLCCKYTATRHHVTRTRKGPSVESPCVESMWFAPSEESYLACLLWRMRRKWMLPLLQKDNSLQMTVVGATRKHCLNRQRRDSRGRQQDGWIKCKCAFSSVTCSLHPRQDVSC